MSLLKITLLLFAASICSCNSQKEKIAVNLTAPQTAYSIPTIIAIEKGFFAENNLDVTINYVKTGKIAMDDLIGGKANFSNVVETNVAFAGFQNPKFKVLCNIEKVFDAAIIARKDKGINSAADLKGKKVGVMLATTSDVFIDRFLDANGISKDSVTVVNLLPPAMQSAIIEGSGVDAVSLWQPFVFNVQQKLGDNAVTFKGKNIFTGYMNLAGNSDFIQQNPAAVEGLLKGYIKAEEFLKNNKAESIEILVRVLGLGKEVIEGIWDEYEFKISMDKELLDATQAEGKWIITSQENFQGKTAPDYSSLFDASYLKKVDESRVKW